MNTRLSPSVCLERSRSFSLLSRRIEIAIGALSVLTIASEPASALDNYIFWRSSGGDNVRWYMSNGSYSHTETLASYVDYDLKMVGTGELTDDGYLDGLCRKVTTTGTGLNYIGFGEPATPIQPLSDLDWEIVGTGYFNGPGDKHSDILWRNKVTGDNAVWFMEGTQFVSAILLQEVPDLDWEVGGTGDLNGDNHWDIVWHHKTTGLNFVWYMQGTSLVTAAQIQTAASTDWGIVGVDYFNADTDVDLLWRNMSTGDNAIWFMDGHDYSSSTMLPYASSYWYVGGTGRTGLSIDSDGSGTTLPDIWERHYFGNLDQTGSDNYDGDPYNNYWEYYYNTDPTDPYNYRYSTSGGTTLGNGVDNLNLTWTESGGWGWAFVKAPDDPGGYRDNHIVSVLPLYDNESTSVQTTVSGPGTVVFRWKVSSQSNSDFLTFHIDAESQMAISGEVDWHHRKVSITGSGDHVLKWVYSKDASGSSGDDQGCLDFVEFYPLGMGGTSLADALETPGLTWSTTGSPTWTPQTGVFSPYGGGDAAEASPGSGQQNYLSTTAQGRGWLFFDWKIRAKSSTTLSLYVDSSSTSAIGGMSDWASEAVYFSWGGSHTIEFRFTGPSGSSAGENFAWVDNVHIYYDTDADGIADVWENFYFGNLNQSGEGDTDADGVNNYIEFLNGTNPTQTELKVKILSPRQYSLLP